uniref:Uncharacterized protein n=1 Tax=Macrostomum lignano TaxID=282301 RepID=A0A1I8FFL9_9PLAT
MQMQRRQFWLVKATGSCVVGDVFGRANRKSYGCGQSIHWLSTTVDHQEEVCDTERTKMLEKDFHHALQRLVAGDGVGSGTAASSEQIKDVLSWPRLQLSRAKLKANRTSPLFYPASPLSPWLSWRSRFRQTVLDLVGSRHGGAQLAAGGCSPALGRAADCRPHAALMISTLLLPQSGERQARNDARTIRASPHDKMRFYIETSWIFSTGLGILLFLVVVVLQTWVKFYAVSKTAAIAATAIIAPP